MAKAKKSVSEAGLRQQEELLNGFDDLMSELSNYAKKADPKNVKKILEVGAEAVVKDLNKLPFPISNIRKPGYTHLIQSFCYQESTNGKHKGQMEIGWGKYYGRMVESGTSLMKAQPHIEPSYDRNKEKYWKLMISQFEK